VAGISADAVTEKGRSVRVAGVPDGGVRLA
jgi:hypothetical protein